MKESSVTKGYYEISQLVLLILLFSGYCFPKGPERMMEWRSIKFVMYKYVTWIKIFSYKIFCLFKKNYQFILSE